MKVMFILYCHLLSVWGFPGGPGGKETAYQYRRHKKSEFDPWVGKIPWSRKWQPTPVFLSGKSMDRGAWQAPVLGAAKELDTTEHTHKHVVAYLCIFLGVIIQLSPKLIVLG